MTMTSDALTALRKREAEALLTLATIRSDIENERMSLLWRQYGVTLGSLVEHRSIIYRVSGLDTLDPCGKPWLLGHKRLKDGGYHKNESTLYDWTLIPEAES